MSESIPPPVEEAVHELPAHWGSVRIKYAAAAQIQNGVGESAQDYDPAWPRYIRITDIDGPRSLSDHSLRSLPPGIAEKAEIQKGDLLLAAVGATFGKSYLHLDDSTPACYAGYLVRYRPDETVLPEWASYWTESTHYWSQVRADVVQSTIQNFSAGRYKELILPRPPLGEQRQLAAYLDRKTAEVDTLIRKKQALIARLGELRAALIHRAVTKGLDPDVPMKDSGVEWLGEVPRHWKEVQLGHLLNKMSNGTTASQADFETPYPVSRIETISSGEIDFGRVGYIEENNLNPRDLLERGDIVLSHINSLAYIGNCAMYDHSIPLVHGMNLLRLEPDRAKVTPRFLLHYLKSDLFRNSIRKQSKHAINQVSVPMSALRPIKVPLPPLDEQKYISECLDERLQQIGDLVRNEKKLIQMLRDLRTSLISEAVTGKVDVRAEPLAEVASPNEADIA